MDSLRVNVDRDELMKCLLSVLKEDLKAVKQGAICFYTVED